MISFKNLHGPLKSLCLGLEAKVNCSRQFPIKY